MCVLREQSGRGLEGETEVKEREKQKREGGGGDGRERNGKRGEKERGIGTAKDKTSILYYSNSLQTWSSLSHAREKERSDGYRRVRKRSLCECRILFSRDWSRSSLLSLQTYCS